MSIDARPGQEQVRAAELVAALCLATDLGAGLPFEHGLQSTLVAMRLAERLGVDLDTAVQTYHGCLLFHAGCTAGAESSADLFAEGALQKHFNPVMFGTSGEVLAGIARALAGRDNTDPVRTLLAARRLPRAARLYVANFAAGCEVAQMISERLGVPAADELALRPHAWVHDLGRGPDLWLLYP